MNSPENAPRWPGRVWRMVFALIVIASNVSLIFSYFHEGKRQVAMLFAAGILAGVYWFFDAYRSER